MVRWKSISIPLAIWQLCARFVNTEKGKIYRNPTDFIIDAIRRELRNNGFLSEH